MFVSDGEMLLPSDRQVREAEKREKLKWEQEHVTLLDCLVFWGAVGFLICIFC